MAGGWGRRAQNGWGPLDNDWGCWAFIEKGHACTQNLKASPTGGEQTESKWSLESVEIGGAVPVLDNAMEVPRYPCAWFCYP